MTLEFDMPPASASFEARGGWLVNHFMAERALGFSNIIHPAAIVGNLGGESGLQAINEKRPMVPGSRGGWGWAQWTAGRRVQFEKYCAENGFDLSADEGQYNFLVWELLNTENRALQQLKKTTTLDAAVYTFEVAFERPSDPQGGLPSRIAFAKRAMAGAASQAAPATPDAPEQKQRRSVPAPTLPPAATVVPGAARTQDVLDAAVRMMQAVLDVADYYSGPIDGVPNEAMYAALETYRAWLEANP